MQFVLIAKDAEDAEVLKRRAAANNNHITYSNFAAEAGEQIISASLLDKKNNIRGTIMIVSFKNRERLNEWLEMEPYMTNKVWDNLDIIPCEVGKSFNHCLRKKT